MVNVKFLRRQYQRISDKDEDANKNLISHWKKEKKKKNNIKEVIAAEFVSEAEATVALNAAVE